MVHENRFFSFFVITIAYLIAGIFGVIIYQQLDIVVWLKVLVADIAATCVIYIFSLIFRNASIYDPYWSIQPIIILALLMTEYSPSNGFLLMFSIITIWGIRLTFNWISTFRNLTKQDWRYTLLQEKSGKLYFLVNFLGIQMFPTLIVYSCILPAIYYIKINGGINFFTFIGLSICIIAILLELIADIQMHNFIKIRSDHSQIIRNGLWQYSRHPNYLGEILMWWGIYIMSLAANPSLWYLGFGALANTFMFFFISIPLSEKHMENYKTNFDQYKKEVRMLI